MSDEYGPWHVGWVENGAPVEHSFDEKPIAGREFELAMSRTDIDGPWVVPQSSRDYSASIRQQAAAERAHPDSIDWTPALDTAAALIQWHERDTDGPLRDLIAATLIDRALGYGLPAWSVIHQTISAIVPDNDPTRHLPEHPPASVADRIATLRGLLADPDERSALLDRARRVAESNRNNSRTGINPDGDAVLSDRLGQLRGNGH